MTRVTAIIDGRMRYAANQAEAAQLVGAAFAKPRAGWAARFFVWQDCESPRGGDEDRIDQLRVVTMLPVGWCALNILRRGAGGTGWQGWDSFNPEAPACAPQLPFGPPGPFMFPHTASLPQETAVAAVQEYCETGKQPSLVKWQESRYF
jgi:hypothetical protein